MSLSKTGFVLIAVILCAVPIHATIPTAERDALVALYNSAGGSGWLDRSGWFGSPGTECQWYGISCNESESTVIDLALWSNNLSGSIPSSIGNLTNLQGLALAGNDLTGPIPSSIGNLTKLLFLNLHENRLSGTIPSSMGSLVKLIELHLFNNQLSGSIPPSLGNLADLETLTLDSNALTGPIPPELGNLSSLRSMYLSGMQLSGSIPASLGQLSTLELLILGSNQLTGSIPPELGQLANLQTLDLQDNRLTGSIPPELGNLVRIEGLHLSINQLTGAIPAELMDLSSLINLSLFANQLSGSLPSSIGNLSNLVYLSLGYNQFSGTIPREIGQLTSLELFEMQGNRLSGGIPVELGGLPVLTYLDLSGNQDNETVLGGLSGPIPVELGNLVHLTTLELSGNDLSGAIPAALGSLAELDWLGLAENRLTGTIPSSLGNLSKLRWLSIYGNRLEGEVPGWLGELPDLTGLLLGGNLLTGTIPGNITELSELETFDICGNFIRGPIPSDIHRLSRLRYLTLCENHLSGEIPDGLWTLNDLIEVRLENNDLGGTLPPELGNLDALEVLLLGQNQVEGEIPPEIGSLSSVIVLSLDSNRLTGTIPREIGQLTTLQFLGLEKNALRGAVPAELMNLVQLEGQGLRLGFNSLFTNDSELRDFINLVHDGSFEDSQTVPPTGVGVSAITDRSAVISWTPIAYLYDEGGYEVTATPAGGGAPVITTTSSKEHDSTILRGLSASTSYSVAVRSTTHPHGFQQNFLRSDASGAAGFTTGPRVTAPASVGIVSLPGGLIQIGGEPQNTTSYTLANFGDLATGITLGQDGAFFTQTPAAFTLGAGESRIVTVASVPGQPADFYWGAAFPVGDGVPEDLYIPIVLLSVAAPTGTAIAEALTSRVELAGAIDSDAIGTVTFRNAGTATLNGVLVSDADWIEPPPELIEIPPGEFRNINFTVRRSRRPDAATGGGGTLFATLRLVYLDGGALGSKTRLANTGSGVNVSVVTVVDTSKPAVESSPIPAPGANEIIRFIPGAIASETKFTDIYLTNSFGSASLSDLRLFFRPAGGGTASVATPASIAPNQSLAFGSIVASVFESASVGTLMIRTGQPESLLLTATLSAAGSVAGPASGAMPVFRSDRAIGPGDRLYLAGIPTAGPYQKILYLQEVSGGEASAIIEAYDAGGNPVGTAQSISSIGGFALVQLTTLSPSAASLIITNGAGSSGALVGWVQIEDTATGDHWGIVDWSRFHGFDPSAAQRVPLVIREGETSSGRRRPARRSGVGGSSSVEDRAETSPPQSTAMALFNPGSTNAVVRLGQWESGVEHEKSVTLGPKQTLVIDDVVRFVRGGSGRSVSSLVVTPLSGSVVTTARLTEAAVGGGQVGAGIPVLAAGSGFRLGQSKLFAGLEDSTRETMTAAIGGTSRTSFGMVEVAGSAVTVRATLLFYSGGAIAGTSISRDFQVGPRSVVLVDEMARAIFGSARESLFGDMKNLQLELRVVEGSGAVNFFVLSTDNGSNDPVLQF